LIFFKESESSLNAWQQSSHPLVLQLKEKIEKATMKRGSDRHLKVKELKKEIKRESYVRTNKPKI
jgi:hypothetical protein